MANEVPNVVLASASVRHAGSGSDQWYELVSSVGFSSVTRDALGELTLVLTQGADPDERAVIVSAKGAEGTTAITAQEDIAGATDTAIAISINTIASASASVDGDFDIVVFALPVGVAVIESVHYSTS